MARVDTRLKALSSEWYTVDDGRKIRREFSFADFKQALVFVNAVGEVAEQRQHHPDILVEYNNVTLTLWTHSKGGLSDKDFSLAAKIDTLL
jgi:4a-hydroxytetrahydrobiopterin dehydratase